MHVSLMIPEIYSVVETSSAYFTFEGNFPVSLFNVRKQRFLSRKRTFANGATDVCVALDFVFDAALQPEKLLFAHQSAPVLLKACMLIDVRPKVRLRPVRGPADLAGVHDRVHVVAIRCRSSYTLLMSAVLQVPMGSFEAAKTSPTPSALADPCVHQLCYFLPYAIAFYLDVFDGYFGEEDFAW